MLSLSLLRGISSRGIVPLSVSSSCSRRAPRRVVTRSSSSFSFSSSSSVEPSSAAAAVATNNTTLEECATTTTTTWHHRRRGPQDAMIKLNVGGKEFVTLRSTVESNVVLAEYYQRHLQQQHATTTASTNNDVIFIDRDPTHFPLILTFLRNKAEGVAYNSKWKETLIKHAQQASSKVCLSASLASKPKYVRLPANVANDVGVLQDLYVEAAYFQLAELMHQLCERSLVTMVLSSTGGNPFEYAQNMFTQARRITLALVGTGSVMATTQADSSWNDASSWLGKYMPLRSLSSSNNKDKEVMHDDKTGKDGLKPKKESAKE